MAVNPQIASIIANGYNRLAEIGLEIIHNYDNGYGLSTKQDELRKRLIKGTKTIRLISKFVEFNDDGDYVGVHRLTDAQINDLLKYLIKVLDIKGLPVAPKIFYRGYPYIRTQGGPGPEGPEGIQGPAGGGTPFSLLSFNDATNIVDRFGLTDDISCKWEYQLYGSLGRRRGTIKAIWTDDGVTISSPEEDSTDDIGATIDNVTFTVEKDGDDIVLVANVDSGTWNVRGLRYFDRNNATLPTSGYLPNGQIYVGNASDAPIARTPGGVVAMTNGGVFSFVAGSIVNADVNANAAIAYSKLNLSASIVNADIASGAAIAYSKLNLSGSIINADISASAAIARSKIATGTAYRFIVNSSTGALAEVAVTANRAVVTDANGLPTASAATATQVGYLSDVTSPIQAQFAGKQSTIATTTNSLIKYNGSAVVATGVYSNTNGNITLGDSGLSGDRTIAVASSSTNASLSYTTKGAGSIHAFYVNSVEEVRVNANGLNIMQTPTNDDTVTQILGRTSGGQVVYRSAASLLTGSSAITGTTGLFGYQGYGLGTNEVLQASSANTTYSGITNVMTVNVKGLVSASITDGFGGSITMGLASTSGNIGRVGLLSHEWISVAGGTSKVKTGMRVGASTTAQLEYYSDGSFNFINTGGSRLAVGASGGISTEGTSGPFLKTKIVEIGSWNMDANATVNVAHGLSDITKFRGVIAVAIISDLGGMSDFLNQKTSGVWSGTMSGSVASVDATNIQLQRLDTASGGWFDGTSYDGTGFNRGWVTIEYEA